ncbi:MAG: BlaI/MecI/CopY family transcriptional regulator [Nannocystaceae bacterium]|nr:BlaI/MecI/CopY family transcriptional regulator [bacterium]
MKGIRIRPEKRGLEAVLFDLEAEIMEFVWGQEDARVSVQDVVDELSRDRDVAYTTVLTTVRRLFDKGLLARTKDGKRYLYLARMSRREFHEELARVLMRSLPPAGRAAAFATLVDEAAQEDDQALARLEAMVRKRRKEKRDE